MRLRLSHLAIADLEDIADYTTSRWSTGQAIAYMEKIQAVCRLLIQQPRMGSEHEEGLRKLRVAEHMVFYQINETEILIVRILHNRMMWDEYL